MKEGYSKEQLIKLLELTIKATRAGSNVEKLTLEGNYVVIHYTGGAKKVNIYYTDEGMEVTEPETARRLADNKVREAAIESNNGGRGFARNVKEQLKKLKCKMCTIGWFHQSKNKKTRILVNATNVMEQVIMPADWKKRWPEFARHIEKYQRKGKNDHDDAEDALTGFVEFINGEVKVKKKARVGNKRKLGL